MNITNLVINASLLSFVIAFAFTPVVIRFAWRFGLIDDPKKNKHPKVIHGHTIPRAGGLATYLGIVMTSLVFLPLDKHLIGIIVGLTILLVIGLLDDKYNLSPYGRLVIQFFAALAPVLAGIGIAFITNPFNQTLDLSQPQLHFYFLGEERSIWILSSLFAICWIISIVNFLNIGAKGIPGQLPGVVGIAAVVITLLSLRFSADITTWQVTILAAITAGAYFGFLPWNFYPQRIMPGFSGSNIAGFMLAVLSILSTTKVGTVLVVLGVPLIDTGYVFARRILAGKSPFWGDRGHLHHRLLDSGLNKVQVTVFYWSVTTLLGILALSLNSTYKLYTIIFVFVFVGGLILSLATLTKNKK